MGHGLRYHVGHMRWDVVCDMGLDAIWNLGWTHVGLGL